MHVLGDGRGVADAAPARRRARGAFGRSRRDRGSGVLSPFRLAAFDLDGTLVDSAPDLTECLGHALDAAGYRRPSLAEATAWIGDGVEALVCQGLAAALGQAPDEALLRRTLDAFDRCYRTRLFRASRVYAGAFAALDEINAAGCRVGCITNKRERYARALLEQADLANRLDFIVGGDTLAAKKPAPEPFLHVAAAYGLEPAQCVLIGDSHNDRIAAAAAGYAFIFAAYGYAPADDASLCAGFAVITSLADLIELLCPRPGAK